MLDIRLIREQPDMVKSRLATRGGGAETHIDEILACDRERRTAETRLQQIQSDRKRISKEIGGRKARGEETSAIEAEVRGLGEEVAKLNATAGELEQKQRDLLLQVPNIPHESVPVGATAEENPVVRMHGEKASFDFKPLTHVEICERLRLIDFTRGAKLSGSGFLLYTGAGARLERALTNFLLELHTTQHGYVEVAPPHIVGAHCMVGVGQFPKFVDQAYAVQEGLDGSTLGKLYLLPTAEAPVANIHREEILSEQQLPIRYVAYSPCFRAEAGASGVGTRGMIRVHQFDKVELIKIVAPENGYAELETLVANAEKVLQLLGLHYRVISLCTGDMGFASAKTYDIEVWAPGQQQYLEVSSCSNCEDYQARRMNLRYKAASGENRLPHILNGSGTALARLYVALLETWQQADGRVAVPEPLRPYFGAGVIEPPANPA
jgi:seryl-tRNA synthetase